MPHNCVGFSPDELREARRAIVSLRNKSEKASGKLKEGSWQKGKMDAIVQGADIALRLMDGDTLTPAERAGLNAADAALKDALQRAEGVIGKFAAGTPQHTLQKNRIAALGVGIALIKQITSS